MKCFPEICHGFLRMSSPLRRIRRFRIYALFFFWARNILSRTKEKTNCNPLSIKISKFYAIPRSVAAVSASCQGGIFCDTRRVDDIAMALWNTIVFRKRRLQLRNELIKGATFTKKCWNEASWWLFFINYRRSSFILNNLMGFSLSSALYSVRFSAISQRNSRHTFNCSSVVIFVDNGRENCRFVGGQEQ